jgi:hypothetical protein
LIEGSTEHASALAGVVPFRRARARPRPRLVSEGSGLGTDQELALVVACGLVLDQIAQECDRSLESIYEALIRFRRDLATTEVDR